MELFLKPGGRLERVDWVYDEEARKGEYVPTDITDQAVEYLMDTVSLEGELYLRDIFALMERNPAMLPVFRRDWAAEFLEEYKKVLPSAPAYKGEYDPDGIEYLELYHYWEKSSTTGEVVGFHRLDFHGIGFELREDILEGDWVMHRKGSRISYAIEFTPLAQLLNLPLRLDSRVRIYESDTEGGNYMSKLDDSLTIDKPSLAQVIHGIIWELSFCGGPEDVAEEREKLRNIKAEVEQAIASGDFSQLTRFEPEHLTNDEREELRKALENCTEEELAQIQDVVDNLAKNKAEG